jgi:hypothetical protein
VPTENSVLVNFDFPMTGVTEMVRVVFKIFVFVPFFFSVELSQFN